MLSRARKQEQVAEFRERFGRATGVYVADFRGIDVEAANELRRKIRSEGKGDFEYRVAKNTVLRLASAGSDAERIAEHFDGPTALAFSYGDPLGLAKILVDFSKEHEAFELKGAVLDGEPVDRGEIAKLATLPSLDGLRAQIVGLLQAPAVKLVRLVSEPGARVARVLAARGREGAEE